MALFKRDRLVGKHIKREAVLELFYTVENIHYGAFYQRYHFYREGEGFVFEHETRERPDNYGPTTKEDVTGAGSLHLTDPEAARFYELLCGGRVKKRETAKETGDRGPWIYLYWKGDKKTYQSFDFPSPEKLGAFVAFCQSLAEASGT